MNRRHLAELLAAFTIAPSAGLAQSLPASIRIASAPDEDVLAALWAQQSGIFRRYAIDAQFLPMNSGAAVAAGVIGGSIEIGKSSMLSLLSAHARGVPIVLVAVASVYDARHPTIGLLVKKSSTFANARDLNGRIFSVPALNDQYSIAIRSWMDQGGGDSHTIKFIELPNAAVAQALDDARIDAGVLGNPLLSEALSGGLVRLFGRPEEAIAKRVIQAAYFCTTDFAAKNRDALGRFARAILESGRYCTAHPRETVDLLSNFTKVPSAVIAGMERVDLGSELDPRLIQPLIEAAVRYGALREGFNAGDMMAFPGKV
jgi:NitT/TauT family transport system substrate-binding protein